MRISLPSYPKAPVLQDVCVFCSTRIQYASARATSRIQRRFLRSSNAAHKPPFGAAAAKEQSRYIPTNEDAPKKTSTFGGGWGKGSFSAELTPEEAAMRAKMAPALPIPPVQYPETRILKYGNSPPSLDWKCQKCQTRNDRHQANCQKCNRFKQRPDATQRRCSSCGWHDSRPGSRCTKCNSFHAGEAQIGDIAKQWKHMRRYGQEPELKPSDIGASEDFGIYNVSATRRRSDGEARLEEERRNRLEQTRNGRFVGLRSIQYDQNNVLRSEETKSRNPRHQLPQNDQSLIRKVSMENVRSQQPPAYLRGSQKPDLTPVAEGSLRYLRGPDSVNPRSSHHSSQSFRSGWVAHERTASNLSDRENSQRPAQSNWSAPVSATRDPRSTAQYTPAGDNQSIPRKAAVADSIEDVPPFQNAYHPPQDISKPSLGTSPQDGRFRMRNKPRDLDPTPSSKPALDTATPYYREQRPRRARHAQDNYEEEEHEYDEDREQARKKRKEQRKRDQAMQKRAQPPTPIYLPEFISVGNLARVLRVRVGDFVRQMKALGFEETNNDHLLDAEVAGLIAAEFNFEVIVDTANENQDLQARTPAEDKSLLPPRPPIVTIMGHVDHGKTTLLDYLRKSSVAASEHGGITQHIGAFSVSMPSGRLVTFLDTPGHAAFLSMRQRGAHVTDIVVLVVAADDSVKPQTVEAIKHAQAAKVPMIVAINKVDKEDKNIDRVKQDLARYNVEIEDFGGDTQVVCVSGKTGQGLDELEENIVALADILDMRAEADGQAEGWILEAATKKAGRVATVLVRRGTINRGDIIVAGSTWAKIRTIKNEAGVQVQQAGPGTPVEVDGWKDQPTAGDEVLQALSEQAAKSAIDYRLAQAAKEQTASDMTAINESRRLEQEKRDALSTTKASPATETDPSTSTAADTTDSLSSTPKSAPDSKTPITLPILLKADVSGSVEACLNAIVALGTPIISPVILRSFVGPISESDIAFAASSGAYIASFNQKTTPEMYRLAEKENVNLVEENVIYRLSDLVKGKLQALLPDKVETRVLGEAEVARGFEIGVGGRKKMMIAGCRVRNGLVSRANKVKVLRGGEGGKIVFDGMLGSLKNVKKDVTEARKGGECGMAFEGWEGFKEGDLVQCYEEKMVKQSL